MKITIHIKMAIHIALALAASLFLVRQATAFCGFYVAKADTGLFNESSQVVMVRDGNRNVVTMASDYLGAAKDFAVVVPVPTVLQRKQIHVTNHAVIKHLDAYSAPRLVEYFDDDPCEQRYVLEAMPAPSAAPMARGAAMQRAKSLGVTIEAQYTVGEYDILLLSAKQSGGLITWLTEQGYKLPTGAGPVVNSYLKQQMKFFLARVNLKEFAKSGYTRLRPIQIAYEHDKFMLPIRLGTVNARGQQELFIYALTRTGRVETTNYRTVKLPSNLEIPPYIKEQGKFADFYRDMFRTQTAKENNQAVFLEYAWDMNWCDPCAADPLSGKELHELGVFWVDKPEQIAAPGAAPNTRIMPPGPARDVYITRLHVRYDRQHFPEDLMFQTTGNRENFQGRYIIRHPFKGKASCAAANDYFNNQLPRRQNEEAKTLARLTNWNINEIRKNLPSLTRPELDDDELDDDDPDNWLDSLWK